MASVVALLVVAPSWAQIELETTEEPVEIPNIEGVDLATGEAVALEELRGSVVVLDIWATWCPPCVAELPDIKKFQEEHTEDRFTYVGLSVDTIEDQKMVKEFVEEKELNYPIFMANREIMQVLGQAIGRGIRGIPTKIVIDRTGNIAFFVEGSPSVNKDLHAAYEARLLELIKTPIPEEYQTAQAE